MRSWNTKNGYVLTQLLGGRSNVFLLTNKETKILIDTGTKRQMKKLDCRLSDLNIEYIDYLILTHTHHDHAANAYTIHKKYKAAVIVHKDEVHHLTEGKPILPQGTNFYSRTLINFLGKKVTPLFRYAPCPYSILVDSFFSLKEYGFNAYILHTPGHSAGSVSLLIDDETAIIGDVMIGRGEYYTYPPFADDPDTLIGSWEKLLSTSCSLFIPSHGYANTRSLIEKVYNKKRKKMKLDRERKT